MVANSHRLLMDARSGTRRVDWLTYHGTKLGVEVRESGLVYVWDAYATARDETFDTATMGVQDFERALERFARDCEPAPVGGTK